MFTDYYAILEISFDSSQKEIKIAFKKQSMIWHPDRNSSEDALKKMQDINEAHLILKDEEAKARYDNEYVHYRKFKQYSETSVDNFNKDNNSRQAEDNYEFKDETLQNWMNNARIQASKLVSKTLTEFKNGTTAAGIEIYKSLMSLLIVSFLLTIIIALSHSCN